MQQQRFWSRVGHWFRSSDRGNGAGDQQDASNGKSKANQTPDQGAVAVKDAIESTADGEAPAEDGVIQPARVRISRRDLSIQKLQEGYNKVVDLVERIQDHMHTQDERSASMAKSLENIATTIGNVNGSSREQVDALRCMQEQMEADAAQSKKLDEQLSQLPRIADAQRETMATVGRQLDSSNQMQGKLNATLGEFQSKMTHLTEATATSTQSLRQIHQDTAAREDRVVKLMESQTRRFTWFASIALILAAIAATIGAIGVLL